MCYFQLLPFIMINISNNKNAMYNNWNDNSKDKNSRNENQNISLFFGFMTQRLFFTSNKTDF